jgi:hypothetical protein
MLCLSFFTRYYLTLATGCGSVSSNSNPTPTPTSTLGATPTPTPLATPTPSPTPTPTPAPSNAAITGRVVDPSGAPVHGIVIVSLVSPGIEFSILKQTNADAQGNFRFDNVPAVPANFESYPIVVAARQVNGDFYAPAILLPGNSDSGIFGVGDPIIPGTNVGTIGLRFSAQGNIEGNVTSTDSTQKIPVPIHVTMALGIFMNDRVLPYPLIDAPGPFDTAAGPACPAGTACFVYRLNAVPTDLAERAVFHKAGYTFTPSQFGVNYQIFPSATSLLNGKPTCNPQSLVVFAAELKPDSPNQAGPDANFTSCQ